MGGQPGNQNAAKGRRWQDAINRALERRSRVDQIAELDRLADAFLDEVEKEGITGYKELADRLDGKPAQAITGEGGGPLVIIQATSTDEGL